MALSEWTMPFVDFCFISSQIMVRIPHAMQMMPLVQEGVSGKKEAMMRSTT